MQKKTSVQLNHVNHLVMANDINMPCVAQWLYNCNQVNILLIFFSRITYFDDQGKNDVYDNNNKFRLH